MKILFIFKLRFYLKKWLQNKKKNKKKTGQVQLGTDGICHVGKSSTWFDLFGLEVK